MPIANGLGIGQPWAGLIANRAGAGGFPFPGGGDFENGSGGGSSSQSIYSGGPFGLVDGRFFTFSCWFKREGMASSNQTILEGHNSPGSDKMKMYIDSGHDLRCDWQRDIDSLGVIQNNLSANGVNVNDTDWHHWMVAGRSDSSPDCLDSFDDTAASMGGVVLSTTNMDFTFNVGLFVGSAGGGGAFDGCIAEVWLTMGTTVAHFLDPTITANRRKFIDASGNAVPLGAMGELPLGSQPILYLPGRGADMVNNVGSGQDFIAWTGDTVPGDCATLPPIA